jgi:two-component system, sensor histidine kinase LadS
MKFTRFTRFLYVLALLWSATIAAAPISLAHVDENAIGFDTTFLKEKEGPLDLDQALAAQQAGEFTHGGKAVLNFGIGSKPVWIHFAVDNPTMAPTHRRLSIENAWLDSVHVYIRHQGKTLASYRVGDDRAFGQRPVNSRFFVFDPLFDPGVSDVFIRIETPDPMVVPIRLMGSDESRIREARQEISYGLVYGFLLALIAYNAILSASLRSSRYLFYSLYLTMFMLMNIAYTGHGFAWIWPESVRWQQWSNPILMFLYGVSGLLFANRFLDLGNHFPRVQKAVIAYCLIFGGALATATLFGSQRYALLVSFTFVFLFTNIMLLLGALSVHSGQKPARYFLLASIAAMVGAVLTTLSTSGFIPFTSWTFRAVELGMLVDATLLALALSYQFRVLQEDKMSAEQLAQLDPLTGLNNRRSFYDKTEPIWSTALRKGRDASIISIDIDLFKQINDTHGHVHGDETLTAIAAALTGSIRQGDVLARWGGEEFIVFMPEANLREAVALAKRLRTAIAQIRVRHATGEITVTASFGVVQKDADHATLDALISSADDYLYQSKQKGRDQVSHAQA